MLEGGEMDCNRNNLSVISVSKGLQTADFPFFFFFLATQAPAGLRAAVRPAAAFRGRQAASTGRRCRL